MFGQSARPKSFVGDRHHPTMRRIYGWAYEHTTNEKEQSKVNIYNNSICINIYLKLLKYSYILTNIKKKKGHCSSMAELFGGLPISKLHATIVEKGE